MNYWTFDLGFQSAGALVKVQLTGNEANVRLADSSNLALAKAGRQFRSIGGGFHSSPVNLAVPSTGHWHVIIDYGGFAGRGSAQVSVRPVAG